MEARRLCGVTPAIAGVDIERVVVGMVCEMVVEGDGEIEGMKVRQLLSTNCWRRKKDKDEDVLPEWGSGG